MPRLENWSVCQRNPYSTECSLVGTVYNHKNKPDGKEIVTSYVIAIENGAIVTSSGSKYELGTVDPNYEKEFPNAKERILNSFNT
jgi:hypothetical protein